MTALDLITTAMRTAQLTASGETPSATEQTDALASLNRMLAAWNIDRLLIYRIASAIYPLTPGKQTYTIGTGGDFNATRPNRIEEANIVLANGGQPLRQPLHIVLDPAEWAAICLQNVGSTIPERLYNDNTFPLANLSLWPYPSAGCSLELFTWMQLPKFATVNDVFTLPDGYEEAVLYNFAARLAVEFGAPIGAGLVKLALDSRAAIESLNAPSPEMQCDSAVLLGGRGGRFDWMSGRVR